MIVKSSCWNSFPHWLQGPLQSILIFIINGKPYYKEESKNQITAVNVLINSLPATSVYVTHAFTFELH